MAHLLLRAVASVALAGGAVVLLYACGADERPPAAGDPATPKYTAPATPLLRDSGVRDDAAAARCSACTNRACTPALTGCTRDAVCTGCFDAAVPACFGNATFGSILDCTCADCAADCELTCADVRCVRCAYAQCRAELDACVANAACALCVSDAPPASCTSDPLAAALFTCTSARCQASGCK